ncbi:MAG: hypothetical protein HYW33_03575 [Candidatus Blackburnbacteria bacterium]|nr:hypothetical protein [Candidatus Blackburnbacteria bacterium]
MNKTSQKGNVAIILLFAILLVGVAAGAYYYGKGELKLPTKQQASSEIQVVATPTPNASNLILEKLVFNIPLDWWSKSYDDVNSGKWANINPQPLPEPGDAVPAFTLYYRPNKTIEEQKTELIDNWGLTDRKEETKNVNGSTVYILKGMSKPGFLESKNMAIALAQKDQNIYYLFDTGTLTNHEVYFDQILSTFKFTN